MPHQRATALQLCIRSLHNNSNSNSNNTPRVSNIPDDTLLWPTSARVCVCVCKRTFVVMVALIVVAVISVVTAALAISAYLMQYIQLHAFVYNILCKRLSCAGLYVRWCVRPFAQLSNWKCNCPYARSFICPSP